LRSGLRSSVPQTRRCTPVLRKRHDNRRREREFLLTAAWVNRISCERMNGCSRHPMLRVRPTSHADCPSSSPCWRLPPSGRWCCRTGCAVRRLPPRSTARLRPAHPSARGGRGGLGGPIASSLFPDAGRSGEPGGTQRLSSVGRAVHLVKRCVDHLRRVRCMACGPTTIGMERAQSFNRRRPSGVQPCRSGT
jgi:hypothetical protein